MTRYSSALHRVVALFPAAWGGVRDEELHDALVALPPAAVLTLDEQLRFWAVSGEVGPSLSPELALVASCHPSGHVRERAVRAIALRTDGREIPFLLARLNDWVPVVRGLAESALWPRLEPARLDAWVALLPVVLALREQSRASSDGIIRAVEEMILGEDGTGAWSRAATEPDLQVRRALVRVAASHRRSVIPAGFSLTSDPDPVVSLQAGRSLVGRAADDPAALHVLWQGPNRMVRRLAVEGLLRLAPDPGALLRQLAFDEDRDLRETGCYELKKQGIDARELYREAARRPGPTGRFAALRALADVADETDADAFLPLLAEPRARRRVFGVSILKKLSPLSVVAALDDPSPRVVRAAVAALLPEVRRLDPGDLWRRLVAAPRRNALAALQLAAALRPWLALEMLARAAALPRPEIAIPAAEAFADLSRSPRALPTERERDELAATLATTLVHLDAEALARVEQELSLPLSPR